MYKSTRIEKCQTVSLHQWSDNSHTYRGEVNYGMQYLLGNSQPYFSITASTERQRKNTKNKEKWFEDSCGCLHELIAEKKKSLAPLIQFHLSDQNGLPLHYLENGYYWYQRDLAIFVGYVRLSSDEEIPEVPEIKLPIELNDNGTELDLPEKEKEKIIESARKKFIIQWLKTREDKLKQEFDEVMKMFSVEYISEEEIDQIKAK